MHLSLQLNLKETHQLLWLHSRLVCDISPALRQQILQYVRVPTPKTCKKEHFLRDYLWNHSVRAVAQFFILVFTPWSLTWDCLTREGATMNSNVHTFRDAVYAVLRLIGVHFVDRGMLIWDLLGNVFILIKHEVRAYEPKSSIFWTITVLMELYKSITMDDASPTFPNFMLPYGWKWRTYNAVPTDDSVIQPNTRKVDSLNRSNLSWMSCPAVRTEDMTNLTVGCSHEKIQLRWPTFWPTTMLQSLQI